MATPITDENAAQFLKPVVDDVVAQVRGIVDPLKQEVDALKAAATTESPPAEDKPKGKEEPLAGGIPEGVDPTDPKSVASYQAKLEASKVDWNDPSAVAAYQAKLQGSSGEGDNEGGTGDESGTKDADAEKASEIAALKAKLAKLERSSNQGGDGTVKVDGLKSVPKIDSFEAGHAMAEIMNGFNKPTKKD